MDRLPQELRDLIWFHVVSTEFGNPTSSQIIAFLDGSSIEYTTEPRIRIRYSKDVARKSSKSDYDWRITKQELEDDLSSRQNFDFKLFQWGFARASTALFREFIAAIEPHVVFQFNNAQQMHDFMAKLDLFYPGKEKKRLPTLLAEFRGQMSIPSQPSKVMFAPEGTSGFPADRILNTWNDVVSACAQRYPCTLAYCYVLDPEHKGMLEGSLGAVSEYFVVVEMHAMFFGSSSEAEHGNTAMGRDVRSLFVEAVRDMRSLTLTPLSETQDT